MKLPAPPVIRIMAACAAADRRLIHPPSAADIIEAHITIARHQGEDFAPWTQEGSDAFRTRRLQA